MTLLLVTSLLSAGFAHRGPGSVAEVEALHALAELGLTAADLCTVPSDGGAMKEMGDCLVCCLAGGMLLPVAAENLKDVELRVAATVQVPAQARVFGRAYDPATPVRAPPLA